MEMTADRREVTWLAGEESGVCIWSAEGGSVITNQGGRSGVARG